MSVPTVDDDAWRTLEPGTAHPLQRLRAVRELVDAGVNAGVLMAPIVPGFSSSRAKLEQTIKAIADHGANFVGCSVMYLQDGTRSHFMKFLERTFPAMVPRYEKLYSKTFPPETYRTEVQAMVRTLQQRYGLAPRTKDKDESEAAAPEETQVGFRW
jgi:DNA repair photolyase